MIEMPLDNPAPVDWHRPPVRPTAGEVHVWRWQCDPLGDCWSSLAWLDSRERERYARLVSDELKQRYLVAHAGLRRLLASYCNCDPSEVQYKTSPTGKPSLVNDALQFNLSHTGAFVAVAVSTDEVGIDIEQLRSVSDVDALAARHFTTSEREGLAGSPRASATHDFFRIWTRKEAVLKCLGIGLTHPAAEIDVGLGRDVRTPVCVPAAWGVPIGCCYVVSGSSRERLFGAVATLSEIRRSTAFGFDSL